MDDLDLLKKDWKKQEKNLPHLSYDEIYKMIWKRSSSIVKWIFIISIIEFLFWAIIDIVLIDKSYWQKVEKAHLTNFTIIVNILSYIITVFFIVKFYLNYKLINTTDSASNLMKTILKTRKTVKYYIAVILIGSAVTTLIALYLMIDQHSATEVVDQTKNYNFDTVTWLKFIGMVIIGLTLLIGTLALLYRIIYGILLKRLKKNYKELKKLEME